ncbi:hypothetical protein S83_042434, partial [Arachis hypogaea]
MLHPVPKPRELDRKGLLPLLLKRFKCPSEAVDTQKSFSVSGKGRAGMPRDVGNNSHGRNCNVGNIVKIIKPIGYLASLSGNTQDILVTFIAV